MAASLKYWRESASLIIASRRLAPLPQPKKGILGSLFAKSNAQNSEAEDLSNEERLRVLMMKRGASASYMPNAYVFPGGKLNDSDFSKDWLQIFCYNTKEQLLNLFTHGKPGPPIFSRDRSAAFAAVPSEVALRLAAIRETFEETGMLLARPRSSLESEGISHGDESVEGCLAEIPPKMMLAWREKVLSDPTEFLNLCQELEVVPDIWSLYEWSNWLTPTFREQRFDTAFFLTCLDSAPQPVHNKSEMVHGTWTSPSALLSAYGHNMIDLGPPQLYGLSRLIRFANIDDLLTLAWKRASYRSQRWMPVLITCKDGLVFLLPGDDLYPSNPDEAGVAKEKVKRTETFDQLCDAYPNHHRAFLSHQDKKLQLFCSIPYVEGHILPHPYTRQAQVRGNW